MPLAVVQDACHDASQRTAWARGQAAAVAGNCGCSAAHLWCDFSCVYDAAGKEVGRARGQAAAVAGYRVRRAARERQRGGRGGRQRQWRRRVQVVTVGFGLQPWPRACRQLDRGFFWGGVQPSRVRGIGRGGCAGARRGVRLAAGYHVRRRAFQR